MEQNTKTKSVTKHEFGEIALNNSLNFDSFIEGDCNRFARSAAYSLTKNKSSSNFNPLMIYGATGVGKTHLLNAIKLEVNNNFPEIDVICKNAINFCGEFVDSVINNTKREFLQICKNYNWLIIDDIQCLYNKEQTQAFFLQLLDHFIENKKVVVLASNTFLGDFKGFDEKIISRIQGGLTVILENPSFETRIEIIKSKIANKNIQFDNDVLMFIASKVELDIKQLEGFLLTVISNSVFLNQEINLNMVSNVFNQFTKPLGIINKIEF